jgi:hypothetical protein
MRPPSLLVKVVWARRAGCPERREGVRLTEVPALNILESDNIRQEQRNAMHIPVPPVRAQTQRNGLK